MTDPRSTGPPDGETSAPVVSVVVTAFNAAATIERALESVLRERSLALECVVVDDGSSDGTARVVEGLAAADARVRLIRLETNAGVSAARNRALDVVRGEWLAFLDADDRLPAGAIRTLHDTARRTGALVVIGQRVWTDGERTWLTERYDNPDIRAPGRKSLATHPGLVFYLSTTSKLFHRSVTAGLRFEGRVLGDQPWTARALLRAGDRVEVIGDLVYEWIRPPADGPLTITSGKAASAEASEAVARAAGAALLEVAAEAAVRVGDPVLRAALVAAYAERLLVSDVGRLVQAWSRRGGDEPGRLFRATGALLAVVPAPARRRSDAFRDAILLPPLRFWDRLGPGARLGFGAVVRWYRAGAATPRDRRNRRRRLRLAALVSRLRPTRAALALARRILR